MSLLEDIFLQDEAGEAQELERIIEGDEYDERQRSLSPDVHEDSERDDEAEEDKRRVEPTQTKSKRIIKNPRFILNPARLTGPRGIQVIPDHFKDFKFKGKGHEKDDLDLILKKLEHWAYRLYPKFEFEDCLKKIETLGKKRPVMVHLQKIRSDQLITEEIVVQKDSSDDETAIPPQEEDEFDKLLQEQITLARATPAPGSAVKTGFDTPIFNKGSALMMPKATSSPSISDDQRERIARNRRLAEERRLARLQQNVTIDQTDNSVTDDIERMETDDFHKVDSLVESNAEVEQEDVVIRKSNKSNVIDSSDEEWDGASVSQSVAVDVHNHMGDKETESINIERNDINKIQDCNDDNHNGYNDISINHEDKSNEIDAEICSSENNKADITVNDITEEIEEEIKRNSTELQTCN